MSWFMPNEPGVIVIHAVTQRILADKIYKSVGRAKAAVGDYPHHLFVSVSFENLLDIHRFNNENQK
jgi:hypothetical protein